MYINIILLWLSVKYDLQFRGGGGLSAVRIKIIYDYNSFKFKKKIYKNKSYSKYDNGGQLVTG